MRKKVFLTTKSAHRRVGSINTSGATTTLCPFCITIIHCTGQWKPRICYTYKYFLVTTHAQYTQYNAQYTLQIYSVADWHIFRLLNSLQRFLKCVFHCISNSWQKLNPLRYLSLCKTIFIKNINFKKARKSLFL